MVEIAEYKFDLTKQHMLDGARRRFEHEAERLPYPPLPQRIAIHVILAGMAFFGFVGAFMTLLVFASSRGLRPKPALFIVAAAVAGVVTSPRLLRRGRKQKLRRIYLRRLEEGLGVGVVGPAFVRFDELGVHWSDTWTDATHSWSLMKEPVCDDRVFTMEAQGKGLLVIPRSVIDERGGVEPLLELVGRYRAASGGLESAMIDFLARTDVECPWCNYNLRDSQELRCSECGRAVELIDL